MDMSFMSKFLVQGRDAGRLLDHLDLRQPGRRHRRQITYTQWLDDAGPIQADLTVTKLDDERYWVVATDTAHRHVETWMRRHSGAHAFVTDTHLGLRPAQRAGPRSRSCSRR